MIYPSESETLEWKTSFSEWKEIIISLASFANAHGGMVVVGIDNRGEYSNFQLGKDSIEDFVNKLKQKTDPILYPSINVKTFALGEIVEIQIPPSDYKPVFAFDRAYKRIGRTNQKLSNKAVRELIKRYNHPDFDIQPVREKFEDIIWDEALLKDLAGLRSKSTSYSIWEVLKSHQLTEEKRVVNAAYLCFTKENILFTNAVVKAARFKGNQPVDFIDMQDFTKSIVRSVEEVLDFTKRHINQKVIIDDNIAHKKEWAYSISALREAIVNAVVHRNYEDKGNVQIRIFDNRLEVWSPGLLPKEIDLKSISKSHRSIPRNTSIAKIFHGFGLIEGWGTGFSRMIEHNRSNGNPSPVFAEIDGAFVITFYPIGGVNGGVNGGVSGGVIGGVNGGVNDLYEVIRENPGKRTVELSKLMNTPRKTIEKWIRKLRDQNKIQFVGSPKTGGYFTIE